MNEEIYISKRLEVEEIDKDAAKEMPPTLCCAIWSVLLKEAGQLYAPL